ncbi:hypothetical protein KC334_g8360 [Hortaea werneckii]|nr:hypothetical protein KC334_g8360 [Hortaea werneckii]KAI6930398.1 hypothetical protein KC355_g16376 [Hortaea werneckii]
MPSHQNSTPPSASTAPQGQPGIPPLRLNITKEQIRAVHAKYKAMKEQGVPNTDPQMMHAKSILSHVKRFQKLRRKQHTEASEPKATSEPVEDPNQPPPVSTQTHEELTGAAASSSPAEPGEAPNVEVTAATPLPPPPLPLTPQQQAEAHRKLSARHLAHAWKFSILAGDIGQAEEVAILAGKLNMMEDFHGEATRLVKGDHGLRARVRDAKVRGGMGEGIGANVHVGGGGVAHLPTASDATEESSDGEDAEALKAERQRMG